MEEDYDETKLDHGLLPPSPLVRLAILYRRILPALVAQCVKGLLPR
jgi:hypothetical protein